MRRFEEILCCPYCYGRLRAATSPTCPSCLAEVGRGKALALDQAHEIARTELLELRRKLDQQEGQDGTERHEAEAEE